jgi:ribonuclease Z
MRELVLLGTASQVPTRTRNHNGYLLRWDDEGLLFDPGEGTQRQFTFAGVSPTAVTRICITHFHGDHCLGLPGVVQRLALDRLDRPLDLYYPASGEEHVDHLLGGSMHGPGVEIRRHPLRGGERIDLGRAWLECLPLHHRVDTLGYRVVEPDGRRMLPDRLAALGVRGPDVGRLQRDGRVLVDGRTVGVADASVVRRGQRFVLLMDTADGPGLRAFAAGADLLVCESTFLDEDAGLARAHGHLTAGQAGRIAADAGVRRLVLTHFSQRYRDASSFGAEAGRHHDDVVVGQDLLRVPVPSRR